MPDASLSVVVVTYNALPFLEQCLSSVAGWDTVVVDNGSTDTTVRFVRDKFPDVRVVEQENLGLGAGWNRGIRETASPYVLILNADAWAVGEGVERLRRFAETHPEAAIVGPRLLNTDGSLPRSVRGFPPPWQPAPDAFSPR